MIKKALQSGFLIWILTACTTPGTKSSEATPESALSRQLAWVLSVFNEHQGQISKADATAHFDPSFLIHISTDQLLGIFQQLAAQYGSFQLDTVDAMVSPGPGAQTQIAHTTTKAGKVRIILSIDVTSGSITGLFVQPEVTPIGAVPKNLNEADQKLQAIAPDSELLIAEVKNGSCQPVHQLRSAQPKAIGSAFKLYVLLALVDQIREKKIRWDDTIAIQDRWKSLPTGTMQDEPNGSTFSVQKFAEQMISISDNTATDHLLHTVGQERVEAAMVRTKHHNPALNIPFLSTRDAFILKIKPFEADAWLKLNTAEREKYRTTKLSASPLPASEADWSAWTEPRHIKTIEWFASGEDMCRVMAGLLKPADKDPGLMETARAFLAKNPGVPFNRSQFPYVGFKGGSEPGVFSLNWLLQRADQRWFVVSLAANDPTKPLPEEDLMAVATGVLRQITAIP